MDGGVPMEEEAPRKRVVLMTEGSRGDHQPYIALAAELQKEFDVLLIVNDGFQALARKAGVENVDCFAYNFQELAKEEMGKMIGVTDPEEMMKLWEPFLNTVFGPRCEEVLRFAKGHDMLLCSPGGIGFYGTAADVEGIPLLMLPLQPGAPTKEWPHILQDPDDPPPLPEGQTFYDTSMNFFRTIMKSMGPRFEQWRATLGLPSRTLEEQIATHFQHETCAGFSDTLVPIPDDFPPGYEAAGYWYIVRDDWEVPQRLDEFLGDGADAPIYVGFGSMVHDKPEELTKEVMKAICSLGERAIMCEGWGSLKEPEEYDRERFLFVKEAYHAAVLPRCKAAVVHGGAGTTAAVARAGIPVLICPFICDQFFWATRVRATGNGLRGPNANDLTSDSLEQSLRALLSDDKYAETAKEVATRVRSEKSFERVARRVRAALQQ